MKEPIKYIHPFLSERSILFPVILLSGIGIIMVYSASSAIAVENHNSVYFYMKKQAFFCLISLCVMFVTASFPYKLYKSFAYIILFAAIGLLLFLVCCRTWPLTPQGAGRPAPCDRCTSRSEAEGVIIADSVFHVVGAGDRTDVAQVPPHTDFRFRKITGRVDQRPLLWACLCLRVIHECAVYSVRHRHRIVECERRLEFRVGISQDDLTLERVVFMISVEVGKCARIGKRTDRVVGDAKRFVGLAIDKDVHLRVSVDLEDGGVSVCVRDDHVGTHDHVHDTIVEDLQIRFFNGCTGFENKPKKGDYDGEKRKATRPEYRHPR